MADDVDITADRAEAEVPRLIAASRQPVPPPATGVCLYCEGPVAVSTRHFCCVECARAWDYERQRRQVNRGTS